MSEEEEKQAKEEAEAKAKAEADANPPKNKGAEAKAEMVVEVKAAAASIKLENDRRERMLEEENKVLDRKEALQALGGQSPAGTKPKKPEKLTDTEYAEALERGEVNPLKEDGFI